MRGRRPPALLVAAFLAAAAFAGESRATGYPNGPTLRMPGELAGKVILVDDGDTLTVLDANNFPRVVRLTHIDAPDSEHGSSFPGQPFSGRATALLKSLTLGRQVTMSCYDIDVRQRNNETTRERYICRVFVDGTNTNMAMLDAGMAMAYQQNSRYVRDQTSYQHEKAARYLRLGIWSQPDPIPVATCIE